MDGLFLALILRIEFELFSETTLRIQINSNQLAPSFSVAFIEFKASNFIIFINYKINPILDFKNSKIKKLYYHQVSRYKLSKLHWKKALGKVLVCGSSANTNQKFGRSPSQIQYGKCRLNGQWEKKMIKKIRRTKKQFPYCMINFLEIFSEFNLILIYSKSAQIYFVVAVAPFQSFLFTKKHLQKNFETHTKNIKFLSHVLILEVVVAF